jgi:Flp pilus assembly protein TadG
MEVPGKTSTNAIEIATPELVPQKIIRPMLRDLRRDRQEHSMRGGIDFLRRAAGAAFVRRTDGSVMPLFALLTVPMLALTGAAIDYSRATSARTALQVALDAAVLAGAKDGTDTWAQTALNLFNANPPRTGTNVGTPSFTIDGNGNYKGSITGSVPTSVLGTLSISSIAIAATSLVAQASGVENSCILTLDHAQASSDVSLTLDGAPAVSLTGCGLRSNSSMNCNGHNGNAAASIAAGTVSNCSNPQAHALVVPDVYWSLSSNIAFKCSSFGNGGVTWDAGSVKPPAGMITVTQTYGTEYHVCGDLTLTGTGYLTGSAPGADTVIVIENGNLNIASDANVSTMRVTIILTGDNTVPSAITFPNGKGHSAIFSVSPSTNPANPWQGISIYQDPYLTNGVDNLWGIGDTWGPGATFNADGVVYLPRSNVTFHGSGASNNSKCTKFVLNTFTTDGSTNLNFSQTSGCTTLGVHQWTSVPIHIAQ